MFDRTLVGAVVRREINRVRGSVAAFVLEAGVSRKTVERVLAGQDNVTFGTLERIEGALDMPRDTLLLIGAHDFDGLAEIGVERDLIRWVAGEAELEGESAPQRAARRRA